MEKHDGKTLRRLTEQELEAVYGAGVSGGLVKLVTAEDMWGNEMSHEQWMDYMSGHIHAHGDSTSADPSKWVHDFTN